MFDVQVRDSRLFNKRVLIIGNGNDILIHKVNCCLYLSVSISTDDSIIIVQI